MDEPPLPLRARRFAVLHHGDQRYGDAPYARHLDDVAALVRSHGEIAEAIAYLHDVLEDTDLAPATLAAEFDSHILRCISLLSDEPGRNRRERKLRTYEKMINAPEELELALLVKAADRLANLRACVSQQDSRRMKMYQDEHPLFRGAVYRPGLCEAIWSEIEELVHQTA